MANTRSEKDVNMVHFCFLAVLVGIVTGFGALLFELLISVIHNFMFYGKFTAHHDDTKLMELSYLGPLVIFVPVIGGLIVVWLVKNFAHEARGHGVPEVMYSVYYKEGVMRPVVAVVKSLASALSIGTGASVGREGPIIQIGASLGSTIGQMFKLVPWQRTTLLAAGAGAGIAATFNTPLGGVMFALEVMMLEVSTRTFLPIVLATGTATYIGRVYEAVVLDGIKPAFIVPTANMNQAEAMSMPELAAFLLLGAVCGVVSWLFISTLSSVERAFGKAFENEYVRTAVGMFMVGTMFYTLSIIYGQYYVAGVGYGTIQEILTGNMTIFSLLLLLFFLKLLATCISLGSGSSGGIFSPALYLGACIGGAFGALLNMIFPGLELSIVEFAMVGMAAVLGGTTGAAVTAVIMIFEMTRDYNIIVPLIVAVAIAIGVRRMIILESIYTIKLLWRGLKVPEERHMNMFLVRHAKDVMDKEILTMPESMLLDEMVHKLKYKNKDKSHVLVTDKDDKIVGSIPITMVMRAAGGVESKTTLHNVMNEKYLKVEEEDIFHDIMKNLRKKNGTVAIVVKDKRKPLTQDNILGVIGKDRIIDSILSYFR